MVRRSEPSSADVPETVSRFLWDVAFINGGIHGWHKTLAKRLAKAPQHETVKPLVEAMTRFHAEVEPIAKAFAFFAADKSRIVKRQPKSEEERKAAFAPPPATTASLLQVKTMLETLVNDQFEALVKRMAERYADMVSRFIEKRDQRLAEIAASDKPNRPYRLVDYLREARGANGSFLSKVLDGDDYGRGTPQVKADAEQIIAGIARADAEEVREFFVAKNLRKIVSIIEAKEKQAAMTECRVVKHTLSIGGLEGAFVVAFADGSGFAFSNAVVFKVNSYGTAFNQFPLTFHDVKLAKGVKMPRPSEARMNTVFLGKEAA